MTVTSLGFMVFLFAGALVYYLIPKKMQWVMLLCLSVCFYFLAAEPYTLVFLLISTILAYISTNLSANDNYEGTKRSGRWTVWVTVAAVVLNTVLWFILKGAPFWMAGGNLIHKIIPSFPVCKALPVAASLGMGYYTAQVIGYILDCSWKICKPQKNILKLFLFVCFFPQLTVGPISKYSELECLYEKHPFSYQNICYGYQRILWGLFKKLVLSDRIAMIVEAVWADTLLFHGIWIWIAVLLYPLEIYTDFSGCMDIILGAAELFDVHLPENFRNPFFARSSQEFWQRWHITLGVWAKDHVYYPVLKSRIILNLGKWAKKHFNKRTAKWIPWAAGMGILWFVMGFWHGSGRHILGVSAYFWTIMILGEICSPVLNIITERLKIRTESFSWRVFQCIRTYGIYAIGAVFFSADNLRGAFLHIRIFMESLKISEWNPWILFDGSLLNTGVTYKDLNIILCGVMALLIVDVLREKYQYARVWISEQILFFRWIVYIVLFFAVIIFGNYGPSYDASSFIYGQF